MKKIHNQLICFGLITTIAFIYLVFFLQIANCQKISWGVKVANLDLGRTNPQTAQKILEEELNNFLGQELNFLYQEKKWLASSQDGLASSQDGPASSQDGPASSQDGPASSQDGPASSNQDGTASSNQDGTVNLINFGFQFNEQATLEAIYRIGRQAGFLANIKEQLIALAGGYRLTPVYQLDQEKFRIKTAKLFKDIERPAQNASLVFNQETDSFSLEHSTEGTAIKRNQLLADLTSRIESLSSQPIELQLALDYPTVKNNEVEEARQKAESILANQPYQLTFGESYWTIDKETIIDWLKFEPVSAEDKEENPNNQILGCSLNEEKIKTHLAEIAKTIDRPTTNARLETEGKRAIVFSAGQAGFRVYQQETIQELTNNILGQPPIKQTKLIADVAPPRISLSQTNNLGINILIGQGNSNFGGSPNNRIHNIKTGTAKFNGLILNPGEEFSFNELLGGSGPAEGFLPELVIKKGKTVPEYGGGLCQVSTTLFRAAVNSGLEITERRPHAFPVVYYSPQGFDATVYNPSPDLRFINNRPGHLLIEGVVQGSQLIFNFYGTDDGRQVQIKGPYILEKKEDGSMKAVLYQEVYQKDELVHQQTFYSNYDSPDLYPIGGSEEDEEED